MLVFSLIDLTDFHVFEFSYPLSLILKDARLVFRNLIYST